MVCFVFEAIVCIINIFLIFRVMIFCEYYEYSRVLFQFRSSKITPFQATKVEVIRGR